MFEDANINIELTMSRSPMNAQEHTLKAHFTNKAQSSLEQVSLQIAVQKYMKLTLAPISNPRLNMGSQRSVTQEMQIVNSEEGKKPIALKIKV